MTYEVWKYPVFISDEFSLSMPIGSKLLSVQTQFGKPQLWALVNPDVPKTDRRFRLAGSGHPIDPKWSDGYVGTWQDLGGSFVWHLFAEVES